MTAPVWVRSSLRVAGRSGYAEVGHLHLAVLVDEDIAWLDVTMDHASAVGEVETRSRCRPRSRPLSGR